MKRLLVFFIVVLISFSGVAKDNLNKIDRNEMKAKVIEENSDADGYKSHVQREYDYLTARYCKNFNVNGLDGYKNISETTKKEFSEKDQSFVANPKISKNNLSIEIIDGRKDKFLIGSVSPRNIKLNDWYGEAYSNAKETIKKILEVKGFKDYGNSDSQLVIRIVRLSENVRVGLISEHITQTCNVAVSVIEDNDTIFSKYFSSSCTYCKNRFSSRYLPLFEKYYCNTLNKKVLQNQEWKQIVKDRMHKHLKENMVYGKVVDFLVVFNDVMNQLVKDNNFQVLLSK